MKIVVVGLLPGAGHVLERACPGHDFRFFAAELKVPKVVEASKHVDLIIGVRNFIPHTLVQAFKGDKRFVLHRSGVKNLIAYVQSLK